MVLVSTRNPLNIGAAARAMSNFGFTRLRLVNPYEPSFREARSAVGASEVLKRAKQYKTVAEAVGDCSLVVGTTAGRNRELVQRLRLPAEDARIIRKRLASGRVALLFGSEKRGLSNDDLAHCHWLMRIPTREEHVSMNLGQAVAVCLYELIRSSTATGKAEKLEAATAAESERLTTVLLEALRASGYVKPRDETATGEKLRRMIRRLNLSADDATVMVGMLRQILWRLQQRAKATPTTETRRHGGHGEKKG
ncbi:MAG TPA: RNA methyltransferase [Candidatus Angelobacter sp.]